jgi:CRP/FNR family transcriptional regulator, anaerobic regulatory protein
MIDQEMLSALLSMQKNVTDKVAIGTEEMGMLLPYIRLNKLKKNELLVATGEVENSMHYIVEGVTRSFFVRDDKEFSFEFFFPGMFITAYASFLTRQPAGHSIEAFTPLTVLSINHDALVELYTKSHKLEELRNYFANELFMKTSERVKDLLSLPARERYLKLVDAYPKYIENIPLKYLASYLNITPESLSRIRKSI